MLLPEDIEIFSDCGLSSKVTLWKGVISGIFLNKMIHGHWVAIPGILLASLEFFWPLLRISRWLQKCCMSSYASALCRKKWKEF